MQKAKLPKQRVKKQSVTVATFTTQRKERIMKKRTTDLLNELKMDKRSFNDYNKNHQEDFISVDHKLFWDEMIKKSETSKANIINASDFGYTYFYDVIAGKKAPSRDKIIRLFLGMHLSLDDCQRALRLYGWAQLYPRFKRDSILIYALNHQFTVYRTIELLTQQNEETLK